MTARTYALGIEYCGTTFNGWQVQGSFMEWDYTIELCRPSRQRHLRWPHRCGRACDASGGELFE